MPLKKIDETAIKESAGICGSSTLLTYELNFIARLDLGTQSAQSA